MLPGFFIQNCHAGKGKEGAGVHFPPSWPTNQLANFPPQMSFAIKTELYCTCGILLPLINLLKYDCCFPVLPSPYYFTCTETLKGYCNETLSNQHQQWFELGRWSRNDCYAALPRLNELSLSEDLRREERMFWNDSRVTSLVSTLPLPISTLLLSSFVQTFMILRLKQEKLPRKTTDYQFVI